MQKKVAVITRTKNRPLLLQRCMQSVLNQTYYDWLHVIINDGGDAAAVDGLASRFAERYQGRIKIIHNPASVGMQNASNLAIRASESEFVTIHDDDDTWHGMFLEECVGYLETAGIQATEQGVAVQSWWIMEEIDSWGNVVEISRQDFMPFESISLFEVAARNAFPPIAFLYRRRAHDAIGYFDQIFNELGDYDFNLRFLSHYDIGTIGKRLAGYHWRHQSSGSSYGNTVTDGLPSHRKQLVHIQNHYLRRDLASREVGLGFLLGVASQMNRQMTSLRDLTDRSKHSQHSIDRIIRKILFYEGILNNVVTPWKARTLPRRVYDHVTDLIANPANGATKNGHAPPDQLAVDISKARIISLDVFDTTLLRLVRKPTDVFLYIQNDVRSLLARPAVGFVEARVNAEEEARQKQRRQHSSSEITLDDIYAVLRARLDCDESTAAQIKQLELRAEQTLCYANPQITQLTARAAHNQKKIIFASDMYLPAATITGLLERNGFKDAPLFVSSELSVNKHEGALFDHLLKNLNCPPSELLHIGDNPHSDVDRPRSKGIGAHHWHSTPAQTPLVDQHTSYSGAWEGDLVSSLYAGLVRRRRLSRPLASAQGNDFWEMIGYEVMGPLHHAFLSWIIDRASKQGLKKLFFLARDGYQLLKGFDLFRSQHNLALTAEYTFASRRLWTLARVNGLDEENLVFLVTPNACMRVRDFFTRIDLPVPDETLVRRFGFKGLEERVTTNLGIFKSEKQHQNMRQLMRSFEAQIVEHSRRERNNLVTYFKDIGLLEDHVGIVDIGWHASSSRSLQMLLALEGAPRRISGFYFGTWKYAVPVMEAGCRFESLFMNFGEPLYRSWIVAESVELLESFFSAPHPTIIGLDKKNGQWEPRYGEPEVDPQMDAQLQVATAASFEFVRDALAICPFSSDHQPPFGYLETVLERLLRYPTPDEARAFGKLSWRNTFGGSGPLRHLAIPPSAWNRISKRDSLQAAYDECYWKKGFLAQLSAKAKGYITP